MKKIYHNLKIFFLFSRYSLRSTLDHRAGVFFFLFGKILRFSFFFFLIFLVFSKNQLLNGYNFTQAIIVFLTFNLIDTATQMVFREVYRFRPLVVSGEFDFILLKPYPVLLRLLFGGFDFLDLVVLFPLCFLFFYFLFQLPSINLFSLIAFFFLLINAFLISTSFHIIVLAMGILFTTVDHAIMIYRDITSFGRFPFDIYRKSLRDFLTFIIPVGVMFSFPPKALFGLLSFQNTIIAFLISLISLFLSLKIWQFALKKYQVGGN